MPVAATTRAAGATAAAALFVAVFPGNIEMAVEWSDRSVLEQVLAYGRLPLQIPLALWALHVRRTGGRPSRLSRNQSSRGPR
jgi:uncharacterized membrane protein